MALSEAPKVIVDTNVLFSAIAQSEGAPARVLLAVLSGQMLVSPTLLDEYRRVLGEPRGLSYLGITTEDLDVLLDFIAGAAAIDPGGLGPICPDPDDQRQWDLLAAGPNSVLITGDRKLLASQHFPDRILSPREFVDRFLATR
jgi:putative PIN family toxin of toxin-antitoxin system